VRFFILSDPEYCEGESKGLRLIFVVLKGHSFAVQASDSFVSGHGFSRAAKAAK
jgi:hypothetical protein